MESREQAVIRDRQLKKQLEKDPVVRKLFQEQIDAMICKGILKEVNEKYPRRYLPILAVTDLNRKSTKVRVCLDARSKFHGLGMNDLLYKGRINMPDI